MTGKVIENLEAMISQIDLILAYIEDDNAESKLLEEISKEKK